MYRLKLPKPKIRGQTLVEFAVVLPLLITVLFALIEIARLLHAWVGVENAARFALRYAVTGEWSTEECYAEYGTDCDDDIEENVARIRSIKGASASGSAAILIDNGAAWDESGYFKTTMCSTPGTLVAPDSTFDSYDCVDEEGAPVDLPGAPGEYVVVVVDFNHPLIAPFLSTWWPKLHLSSQRMGRVEDYRTSTIPGVPPGAETSTPTSTKTNTPDVTPTPSLTMTISPTPTDTPDCSQFELVSHAIVDDQIEVYVRNNGAASALLTGSSFNWEKYDPAIRVDYALWNGSQYYPGDDDTPPTFIDPVPPLDFPNGIDVLWHGDFDGTGGGYTGDYYVLLTFDYVCPIVASLGTLDPPQGTSTPTSAVPSETPTATTEATVCDDLVVNNELLEGLGNDDFQFKTQNNTGQNAYLIDSTLWWPAAEYAPDQYFWFFRFDGNQYYAPGVAITTSPVSSAAPNLLLSPGENDNWEADFSVPNPPDILYGTYIATLTFQLEDSTICQVTGTAHRDDPTLPTATPTSDTTLTPTPSPTSTPSCDQFIVNNHYILGDEVRVEVTNLTGSNALFTGSDFTWTDYDPALYVDYIRWNSVIFYNGDDYGPPTNDDPAPAMSFPAGSPITWIADFDGTSTYTGDYSVTLTFDYICPITVTSGVIPTPTNTPTTTPTITATNSTPTNTPNSTVTPTPDCSLIYASAVRLKGDDFEIEVTNDNQADASLTTTNLIWNDALWPGIYIDDIDWDGSTFDTGDYFSSPTNGISSNRLLAAGDTGLMEVDFGSRPQQGIWGYYRGDLVFTFPGWGTCPVSAEITGPPLPTWTPTATVTSTNTPLPGTPTPTPTPSCSNVYVTHTDVDGDKYEVKVINNNVAPAYLTYSTLTWPANDYYPPQFVNYLRWNGTTYHTTDYTSSPVNASAPNMLFVGGGHHWWVADFDGVSKIYGTYSATLTYEFDNGLTCQVTGTDTLVWTPSRTPTPTIDLGVTYTPTNTASPSPTGTVDPTSTAGGPSD
ncbi:MAG: hypothetical protein GTO18_08290 [Anaerolineales bacterium]|nr:hypothetical protein [Anaerolineales bacterium]